MRKFIATILIAVISGVVARPSWGEGEMINMERNNHADSEFPETNNDDQMMLIGYELSIKREVEKKPPGGSVHSWPEFWTKILNYLSERNPDGTYVIQNHDKYKNYIIVRRRQAGLPDIPGYH